mmetsp:Transcript_10893/g.16532  ORF Transcript_10893/g.16532 Transcript_10893/m.16532 type:complete len:103 (+) Transcript_10893:1246-1554(+)
MEEIRSEIIPKMKYELAEQREDYNKQIKDIHKELEFKIQEIDSTIIKAHQDLEDVAKGKGSSDHPSVLAIDVEAGKRQMSDLQAKQGSLEKTLDEVAVILAC